MLYFCLTLWYAYWYAEAGGSLPWSSKWQTSWTKFIPEFLLAVTTGCLGASGFWTAGSLEYVLAALCLSGVSYAGLQSATWAYLPWVSHVPRNPDRQSTLRGFIDKLATVFGSYLGKESYSWIWAAVKGFIITAPVGCTGVILHPLGHEIGYHIGKRLPGDPNMYKELISGATLGSASVLYLYLMH